MALLTGPAQIFSGNTDIVDATAKMALNTRAFDASGNEYIYLNGVTSCAIGSWVTYDDGVATLTVANSKGRVAIAMAAVDTATKAGWFQIFGKNTVAKGASGSIDDNDKLWVTSTPGVVDDTDVAVDIIVGAIARSADTSGVFTVEISYPFCHNEVLN